MPLLPTWRTMTHLVSILLVALSISCGGGGGGGVSSRAFEGSLQVYNDGHSSMGQLFVTPSSSSTWGPDQLAPNVLFPGEFITLIHLSPGSYDVKAVFADQSSDEVFDVLVQDGLRTTLGMLNSGNGSVAVVNRSGLTVNGIYLTPVSTSTWGPNQVGQPLLSGDSLTLTGIAPNAYDLRVIFSNGNYLDYLNISVISGATTTIQVN